MSMDTQSLIALPRLLRATRIAALGTLRDGAPFVSMVPFVAAPDLSAFHIHISRLAHHTKDILADPRVSLMVAQTDLGTGDPQTLVRVSIQGTASALPADDPDYGAARARYLGRFPDAEFNFSLGDFALYRIEPRAARYVGGFGKILNLEPAHLTKAAVAASQ
jgi:hypothetical protein